MFQALRILIGYTYFNHTNKSIYIRENKRTIWKARLNGKQFRFYVLLTVRRSKGYRKHIKNN